MLGDKNHLSHVVGVVRELAVNRLHHGMRFAPNICRPAEVRVRKRLKRIEGQVRGLARMVADDAGSRLPCAARTMPTRCG